MLEIKKVHDGYIVARKNSEAHSHFRHRSAYKQLIRLIDLGLMPRNKYFSEAARRILTQDERDSLEEWDKQTYINRVRG